MQLSQSVSVTLSTSESSQAYCDTTGHLLTPVQGHLNLKGQPFGHVCTALPTSIINMSYNRFVLAIHKEYINAKN